MTVSSPAVKAEGVWFAYRKALWVLKGLSLEVPQGGCLTILGPSGTGKTTLFKLLAGLLRPQQGRVELLGHATGNGLSPDIRQKIGYIPQQLGLVRSLSALENVLMGALGRRRGLGPLLGLFPKEEVERARSYLDLLGILPKAQEKVFRLSGGERQRVAIARTLLQNPTIIFADEFISDLDLPRAAEILTTMRQIAAQKGITLVLNMHELSLVQEFGDRTIILREGKIVHEGPGQELTWAMLEETVG